MKHVPNALSISRIVLACILFLFEPLSFWFMVLYVTAILTDIVDGPIARATGGVTKFGSSLDGTADIIFALIAIYLIVPLLDISAGLLIWILILVCMRISDIAILAIRLRKYYTSHTIMGRLTALSGALIPVVYLIVGSTTFIYGITTFATIAFTENIMISCKAKYVQVDLKSYFSKDASWRVNGEEV